MRKEKTRFKLKMDILSVSKSNFEHRITNVEVGKWFGAFFAKFIVGFFVIQSGDLMAAGPANEDIRFVLPASPLNEAIFVLLIGIIFILAGIIIWLLRNASGDRDEGLPPETRQRVESGLIEKMRKDFESQSEKLQGQISATRNRTAEVVLKIRNLTATLEPEKVFNAISELLVHELGVSSFIFFLPDRETEELFPCRWQGFPDNIGEQMVIGQSQEHLVAISFQSGQVVSRKIAEFDPKTRALLGKAPLVNFHVMVPVATPRQRYGVIVISGFLDNRSEVTDADLRFFSALTTFMGMALENANIFLQTRSELLSSKQLS